MKANAGSTKFVLTLVLVMAVLPSANAQVPGDVTGDGFVTVQDAYRLEQYIKKGESRGVKPLSVDTNRDSKVDMRDVDWIRANLSKNEYRANTIILDQSTDWALAEESPSTITLDWLGNGTPPTLLGQVLFKESLLRPSRSWTFWRFDLV